MSLIEGLQNILRTDRPTSGKVLSVTANRARVATSSGLMEVSHTGELKAGEQVMVEGGAAVKAQSDRAVQRFFV